MKTDRFHLLALVFLSAIACIPRAHAASASETVSQGAASIAASPLASVQGGPVQASAFFVAGASFVVVGMGAAAAEGVSLVVQSSVDGSRAVVKASAAVASEAGVAVGSAIKVVATSTGYALLASGKILAFVPNAAGSALLYQLRLSK